LSARYAIGGTIGPSVTGIPLESHLRGGVAVGEAANVAAAFVRLGPTGVDETNGLAMVGSGDVVATMWKESAWV
jgi:hypothetical protein